ncbi:MAG TPA: hypothetical protein VFJ55_05805 [Chthoniobacterales bacterium]|nr:hypothetical protein [Chthoniobacterales bacterium]
MNKLQFVWRPAGAYHDPEHKSHGSVDEDPDDMAIVTEYVKDGDLNDPFGDEN